MITAVNAVFSKMGSPHGLAEGGPHLPAGIGVISGRDPFKGGHPYVNQIFIGYAGGAALNGHDGWLTYCGPANGGLINLDSIEVHESMYPIIIESRGVRPDTQGYGEFEGAPGVVCVFYPVDHAMTIIYAADGTMFAPKASTAECPREQWTREAEHGRVSAGASGLPPGGVRAWGEDALLRLRRRRIRRSGETRPRPGGGDRQSRLADGRQGATNLRRVPSLR